MVVAAGFSALIAVVVWFFLIPNPEDVGIVVEELTDKEALIGAATEENMYNNVIRNSINHSPD